MSAEGITQLPLVNQTARAWIAFLVAPGGPGAALYVVGRLKGYGDGAIVGPLLLAPLAYLVALVVGVPVYMILQRKGIRGFGAYMILGTTIGVAAVGLIFGPEAFHWWIGANEHPIAFLRPLGAEMVVAVIYAFASTALFWFIAIRREA